MKMKLIIPLLSMALAAPVVAEKPEWAGKGKPTQEQKEAHQLAMDAKEGEQEKLKLEKDKKDKKDKKDNTEKVSGIEKQTEKKSTQVQKELDKGSDKGKESREKSKKWWKFWGE